MKVRCPNCQQPIDFVDEELDQIDCPSCGSSFSLLGDETVSYRGSEQPTIGHFELQEPLGSGAYGCVWKARDTKLDRSVAVKIPRKRDLSVREMEQFFREARTAAQLKHPGIVSVHEVGREDDQLYIVSDLINGVSLSSWLSAKRPTFEESAAMVRKIANALHYAHDAGVIHRDLKPSNIMIDGDGELHVTDFGLAKREAKEVTMTMDGIVLGTPAYMSPEQASGQAHAADRRSDVYSLGVMLFEMLTGDKPFRGDHRMLIYQVINEDAKGPRSLQSSVPKDLDTITLKCLEKEPQRRYSTAKDLADDLGRFIDGEPVLARPIGSAAKLVRWCKREPKIAALGTLAMLLLVVGTVVSSYFAVLANNRSIRLEVEKENATNSATLAQEREAEATVAKQDAVSALKQAKLRDYFNRIGLAAAEVREHDAFEARSILDTCEEDFRNWEWRYLQKKADFSSEVRKTRDLPVLDLAVAADSMRYTCASGIHFEIRGLGPDVSGQKGRSAAQGAGPEFGQLGKRISVAMHHGGFTPSDETAEISPDVMQQFAGSRLIHTCSPDGSLIAVAQGMGKVTVMEAKSGKTVHSSRVFSGRYGLGPSTDICFKPDGSAIAVASMGNLLLFDPKTGESLFERRTGPLISRICFSPDGKVLALSVKKGGSSHSSTSSIQIRNSSDGDLIGLLAGHNDDILDIAFDRTGNLLASGGADKTVRVWDWKRREQLRCMLGHDYSVTSITFGPSGRHVLSGDYAGFVRFFEFAPSKDAFFNLKNSIACTHSNGTVFLSDTASRGKPRVLQASTGSVRGLEFGDNGKSLVTAGESLELWNPESGERKKRLPERSPIFDCVAYSPDGRYIFTAYFGYSWGQKTYTQARPYVGKAALWDPETGTTLWQQEIRAPIYCAQFSLDSSQIAVGGFKRMDILEASTGETKVHLEYPDEIGAHVACLDVSPDGKRLAFGHANTPPDRFSIALLRVMPQKKSGVQIRDFETGDLLKELEGHEGGVYGVSFDPVGRRVASGGADGLVRTWDIETERQIAELNGHDGPVFSVDFSATNDKLASAGFDSTIRVWDLQSGDGKIIGRDGGVPSGLARGARSTILDQRVFCAKFDPSDNYVLTGSFAGLRAYDAAGTGRLPLFSYHAGVIKNYLVSPNSETLATVGNRILVWDTLTGEKRHELDGNGFDVVRTAFDKQGDRLFAGFKDGSIASWNMSSGEREESVTAHSNTITQFRFTPDYKYLLTAGLDKAFAFWTTNPLKVHFRRQFEEVPGTVAFTEDTATMAFAFSDGEIQILDARSGEIRCKMLGHGDNQSSDITKQVKKSGVPSMAFSKDGTRLATLGGDKKLKLWDTATGESVLDIPVPQQLLGRITEFSAERILVSDSTRLFEFLATEPSAPSQRSTGDAEPQD